MAIHKAPAPTRRFLRGAIAYRGFVPVTPPAGPGATNVVIVLVLMCHSTVLLPLLL